MHARARFGWLAGLAIASTALPVATNSAAPLNLLANGGFEHGARDWTCHGEGRVERDPEPGLAALRIQRGWAEQRLDGLSPGARFTVSARLKVDALTATAPRGYAFLAVYQLDDFDDLITAHDFVQAATPADWAQYHHTFSVAEGCRTVSIRCGLYGANGTIRCDDFAVVPGEEAVDFAKLREEARAATRLPGATLSPTGNIAVLQDDLPASGGAASPGQLAALLRGAGLGTVLLDSAQLADARFLNRDVFDVVVLPYGPSFPVRAADNFRRFLRDGGKFFSTGGYAFDALLERSHAGWVPAVPAPATPPEHALWQYAIPASELRGRGRLTFSGFLKAGRILGPGMAYFAVYQSAADGSLPAWKDLCQVRRPQDWTEHRYTFDVHPAATSVELRAGLFRCSGVACFDDVRIEDESGQVLLAADCESPLELDRAGARQWRRSDRPRCTLQSRTRRSGDGALKVRLDFAEARAERLNTRHGVPGDELRVEPTQLGVFQADYPLEHVRWAGAAVDQCVVEPGLRIESELTGWAACGVVGFDQARWVPLLNGYDAYGRLRGAVGGLLRHYAGPYAGSSWAGFGVTNRDVFAASERGMPAAFVRVIRSLVRDTYCAALVSEPACVRPGEAVQWVATLCNGGRQERRVNWTVSLFAGDRAAGTLATAPAGPKAGPPPAGRLTATVTLAPGETNVVVLEWEPGRFGSDFYRAVGQLDEGGTEIDRIESGVVVRDPQVIAQGPQLGLQNNYLQFGRRPLFLFGTDDWGYVFETARETPLQWRRDMQQRRDLGVQIYENLQFGVPARARSERLLRKVDAIVQLAQQCGQVYFAGLLVGANTAASDAELGVGQQFCREFAARYAEVPGLIYYLNGDLRCELSGAVSPQWNEFLRQRYGSTARLREAWEESAPAIGSLPAEDFNDWGRPWADVRVYDQNRFRAALIRRWCGSLIAGLREADRQHPTSAEFYQLPHQGVDLPAAIDGLDLANFGYFDKPGLDLERFPVIGKYNDQRWRGKSTGPGEYGAKVHPAWGDGGDYGYHTARTREQAIELFLGMAHYSLGLGASRIHNWCWKDDAHRVFPWGMVYPCDGVPKDLAYVHRNQSLLFRHFAPVYQPPTVYVLTPDSHRLGGGKWAVTQGILQSIDLALATHVDNLGVLNEDGLIPERGEDLSPVQALRRPKDRASRMERAAAVPGLQALRQARVIFYPIPFCPPDAVCAVLLDWVRQGGVLYLSGDVSYDELRRRTRTNRLEQICGVRFLQANFPDITVNTNSVADQPCIRVEATGARVLRSRPDGSPLLVENRLGQGRVLFTPDPIELHSTRARRGQDVTLYRSVLAGAQVEPIRLSPDDPSWLVFRVPLADGGRVYVVFNRDGAPARRRVTVFDGPRALTLEVDRNRPGLVWVDGRGALRAVEAQGTCAVDGTPMLRDETGGILLGLDGADLRRSKALVWMPLAPGVCRLAGAAEWRAPVVETGEFRQGRWQTLDQQALVPGRGELVLTASADQSMSLLLVSERSALPRGRHALEHAIMNPAELP